MKNAIITTTLGNLLEVLEARSNVDIFVATKVMTGEETEYKLLRSDRIYTLLADNEFITKYEYYRVTGISITLGKISVSIVTDKIFNN